MEFLFKCDGKRCEKCNKETCKHTTHIENAIDIPNNVREWIEDNFDILQPENIAIQKDITLH